MLIAITYGTLPDRELFGRAFERECPGGTFNVPEHGNLTQEQTWTLVETGVQAFERTGDTCETDLAGAVLYLLGIEWV